MTPRLADLSMALTHHIRNEIEAAPPQYRLNAEQLAQLEAADYDDQLRACESDQEREALSRRWLRTYNP